ncbi:MAG: outer membrane beta-barrel protein [Bacteroidota bacterium]|nr:outer membrane beta-barrel protein [Bacteroidota bacterium]MDP4216392.1 outer membrane beta-barrel protein [Bacteroidota bacterium]MDP4245513.1 outer membrane beta-barrel protein [Bacteroidota bacterium]MDP4255813.1 outer membrane beta-barrel protein [Bacteroidota bacterium]MDP4258984.1 outer membrane beta-barrel protein [Bacteroidota bacterium]
MKKVSAIVLAILATTTAALAQQKDSVTTAKRPVQVPAAPAPVNPAPAKKDWSKVTLARRANDHFMFQFGYPSWAGATDSMHIRGWNRSANFYFMFDFPFKTDPRFSVGAGLGLGTSNIFFSKQEVLVASLSNTTLAFPSEDNANHYKKYKLVNTYLEAPVELRFALDPENTNKSWKFAAGVKVGLMMTAYTKGKTLVNNVGQTIASVTVKNYSKQYFNSSRLAGTLRVSKGVIGLYGQFQVNGLLKPSAGPAVFPFEFGLSLSGL